MSGGGGLLRRVSAAALRDRARRGRGLLLLALVAAFGLGGAARADAVIVVAADATSDPGYFTLVGFASTDIKTAFIAERTPTSLEPIAGFELQYRRDDPVHGPVGDHVLRRATRWRCDRLNREFVIAGRRQSDGVLETASFTVRTPSCRDRLELRVPRRVEPGDKFVVEVRDSWNAGGTAGEVCLGDRCRQFALAEGVASKALRFRAYGSGVRRVVLTAPSQAVDVPLAVGVRPPPREDDVPTIVTTGDSMMQSLDAILGDEVLDEADIVSDVHVGTGLSSAEQGWYQVARRQVAATRPEATIVFLGANDLFAMTTPGGRTVECCGRVWTEEYERRATNLMRIYAQGGRGTVLWLTLPVMRDPRRNPAARAVNRALDRAARAVGPAELLHTGAIFTPRGRYQGHVRVDGRRVDVRETDGIHLSIPGARIAAGFVVEFLRSAGVLADAD